MELDSNGLEVLERDECLRLLSKATIGRVGVTSGALPTILPVNFHLDGDRILIRTGMGSKLDTALRNAVVAFEVDDWDAFDHTGWSVVVTGIASAVTDPDDFDRVMRLPLARWATEGEYAVMALSTDLVSGRRLQPRVATAVAS